MLLWPLIARLRRVIDRGVDGSGAGGTGGPDGDGGTGGSAGHGADGPTADVPVERDLQDSAPGSRSTTQPRKEPES